MTKEMLLLLALSVALTIVAAVVKSRAWGGRPKGEIKAKKLLTEREQPMYFRLRQAFPDDVVLSQVAFSALLTAKELPTRQRFNRKVADFVVATKAFDVLAVIELDDASHRGREVADSQRDSMLEQAGYRVLRFKHVPNVVDVQQAVRSLAQRPAAAQATGS